MNSPRAYVINSPGTILINSPGANSWGGESDVLYSKWYSVFFCIAVPVSDPLEEYGDPALKELFKLCSQWSLGWGKKLLILVYGSWLSPFVLTIFIYPRLNFGICLLLFLKWHLLLIAAKDIWADWEDKWAGKNGRLSGKKVDIWADYLYTCELMPLQLGRTKIAQFIYESTFDCCPVWMLIFLWNNSQAFSVCSYSGFAW